MAVHIWTASRLNKTASSTLSDICDGKIPFEEFNVKTAVMRARLLTQFCVNNMQYLRFDKHPSQSVTIDYIVCILL